MVSAGRSSVSDLLVDELQAHGGRVSVVRADLSSLQSVAEASGAVIDLVRSDGLPPIRGLVCNAGVQHTNALTETVNGFESTFAVNVLANHVLVRKLEHHLHPQARVVVTVSDTHFGDFRHNLGMVPGPRWQPVETLARVGAFPDPASTRAGRTAYSTSKLAAIYLVHEYARRLPATWTIAGYNPGFVPGTDLARDADSVSRFAMRWIMPLMTLTPFATSLRKAGWFLADAALGVIEAPSGAYIDRHEVARSSPESYDPQREQNTWDAVEALTAGFIHLTRP
ncbi:SDR family NAD(P)-dependent oxidoreductase [Tessaracoccus caeni]|uniref:SDR family NAD(P)-dependent oxidoreductase n=1 Tax=Tessaracoccus caeni TaxID=3031239 RepID=UPI0023DA60C7|nr:SDR family NAD(P)-dependent oxidoreductase [Tessaracoccus caeni]MDF1487714.1 SDR family NAD(P)-dependent oxidoreductase [Tessaracoccus caeni]